jgi:hypothetical protein
LLEIAALVLLGPGVRQSPRKTGDGMISGRSVLNDRRYGPRRHESQGSQQANMAFDLAFFPGD